MDQINGQIKIPGWIPLFLKLSGAIYVSAGIYHLLPFGNFLALLNISMPVYQPYMSWIGIIMVMLGCVSIVMAYNPLRSLHIIFILFVAKLLISAQLAINILNQEISSHFFIAIFCIDTIWAPVYGIITYELVCAKNRVSRQPASPQKIIRVLSELTTQGERSLADLSTQKPIVALCVRHLGCVYLSDFFDDLNRRYDSIKKLGFDVALIHMSSEITAMHELKKLNADRFHRISDPEKRFCSLNLLRPEFFRRFFGVKFLLSGICYLKSRKNQRQIWGNPLQMHAVFIIYKNRVLYQKNSRYIGDSIDYVAIIHSVMHEVEKINQTTDRENKETRKKILYHNFRKDA